MFHTICIFGDSIAWGAVDGVAGGWANRLITNAFAVDGSDIYNLSIPGNTTVDILARLEREVLPRRPNHIVFAVGINDSKYETRSEKPIVDFTIFQKNVSELYRIGVSKNARVSFVGLTRVDESKTKPTLEAPELSFSNDRIGQYDEVIKDFCARQSVAYCDVSTVVGIDELSDGLHPNAVGHEKLYNVVKHFLEK